MMQPSKGYDIKQEVRRQILALASNMEPQSRGKLPSETNLADRFGVSRLTIRTVLAELAVEGKVRRKHGAGTFVVSSAAEENVVCFHSRVYFEEVIQQSGMHSRVDVEKIRVIPADQETCSRLSLRMARRSCRFAKYFMATKNSPYTTLWFYRQDTQRKPTSIHIGFPAMQYGKWLNVSPPGKALRHWSVKSRRSGRPTVRGRRSCCHI